MVLAENRYLGRFKAIKISKFAKFPILRKNAKISLSYAIDLEKNHISPLPLIQRNENVTVPALLLVSEIEKIVVVVVAVVAVAAGIAMFVPAVVASVSSVAVFAAAFVVAEFSVAFVAVAVVALFVVAKLSGVD